jgi:type III secretory pathway component EscU
LSGCITFQKAEAGLIFHHFLAEIRTLDLSVASINFVITEEHIAIKSFIGFHLTTPLSKISLVMLYVVI